MSYQLHFGWKFLIYHVKMINTNDKVFKVISANSSSFCIHDKICDNCQTGSQVPQLMSVII